MRENCTSGSVRGAPGNWRSYRKSLLAGHSGVRNERYEMELIAI
jgi:hypothetical protein